MLRSENIFATHFKYRSALITVILLCHCLFVFVVSSFYTFCSDFFFFVISLLVKIILSAIIFPSWHYIASFSLQYFWCLSVQVHSPPELYPVKYIVLLGLRFGHSFSRQSKEWLSWANVIIPCKSKRSNLLPRSIHVSWIFWKAIDIPPPLS